MKLSWVRPAPNQIRLGYRRHVLHTGTSYHTCASWNAATTSGTRPDDLIVPQRTKKVSRRGNNTSELALQQVGLTPLRRERKDTRSKATWEHASDRTFIDINPGLGGFHQAFRRHGFRLLCAVEQDSRNAEVYKHNFRGAKVKVGELSSGVLPHFASVLTLSCHEGDGHTLSIVLKHVASKATQRRPLLLVIEHAVSFASMDKYKKPTGEFARLRAQLADMGYHLQWRIYESDRFGLPLQRERLFMIAVKESYSQEPFEFPNSPFTPAQAYEITVRSILEDQTSVDLETVVHKGPGQLHWRDTPEVIRTMIRVGHYHNPDRQNKRERQHPIFSDMGHVPAVDPNEPFYIQTLASENSNLSRSSHTPLEHNKDGKLTMVRMLTPRELARLYGFSDDTHVWKEQHLAWKHIPYSVSPCIADVLAGAIVVQYFTGPQKRPKAYWDGAKDAELPLMKELLKRLEGDVQLLRRDLSLAREQLVEHRVELRELRRRLEEMKDNQT